MTLPAAVIDAVGLFLPRAGMRGSTFLRTGASAGPSAAVTYAKQGVAFNSRLEQSDCTSVPALTVMHRIPEGELTASF
jgi:hypothetical protein